MVSKILVTTDGSETAWRAARYALDFAKQLNASVTLISVVDKSAFISKSIPAVATPTNVIEPIENYLNLAAETYVKQIEKLSKRKRIKTKTVIRTGYPAEEIIKEARRSKVDLIIMGSHGKSALETAVLGSVTFGVINKAAKFPVLVVRK